MTARTGMATPIQRLRELTNVGTADYTLGTVAYWSDDALQGVLDRFRQDIYRERLTAVSTTITGSAYYYDYYAPVREYEQGTAYFRIYNAGGTAITPTEINYEAGHISFGTVNQHGSAYFLTARAYDLNGAAAHVWRAKAANVAAYYDFSADGHSMSRSQMVRQFQEMADQFSAQAKAFTVQLRRGDDPGGGESEDD